MANNDEFFKGQKPAAVLKHAVFTSYAHAFSSMVTKGRAGPLWLIDGYAGPGKYEADETGVQINGSPIVALELAMKQRGFATPRDVRCAFIEANRSYVGQLVENVKPFQELGLYARVHHGSVAEHLPSVWQLVGNDPVLTFIDPFGVAAVGNDIMTGMLLAAGRSSPSEVLVNINIEAISRHGGYLQWNNDGEPEIRPDLKPHGVELSDAFFGGTWWRRVFLRARYQTHDGNAAAVAVVHEYRERVRAETGADSLVIPIRRSPNGAILFSFTLFYRHPAAAYKFADAAASGTAKWREAFRQKDLEDVLSPKNGQESLFADYLRTFSEKDAKEREAALSDDAVAHIEENIWDMLASMAPGQGLQLGTHVTQLLGDYLSIAGERSIRRAWDNLAVQSVVQSRNKAKSASMWRQVIIKR